MPTYTPPSGCSADFTDIPLWISVSCYAANFDLIGSTIGITVVDSSIDINSSVAFFLCGSLIEIEESFININSSISGYQTLSEITTYPSIIQVTSETSLFRILPDCIIQPSYINIESSIQEVRAGRPQDLPNKLNGNFSVPWDSAELVDEFYDSSWEQADRLDRFTDLPISVMSHIDDTIDGGWSQLEKLDNLIDNKIGILSYADIGVKSFWNVMNIADRHSIIPWNNADLSDKEIIVPYNEPGAKDRSFKTSFTTFSGFTDHWFIAKWNEPGAKDKHHLVPWGPLSYFTFCKNVYYPPEACSTNFKAKVIQSDLVGTCYQVVFDPISYDHDIRCPFKHYQSGRRDPYIGGILVKHIYPPGLKETYKVLNTVLVKRLPDNVPIEIISASIKYDDQSYTWQFSLQIPKNTILGVDYLELIKPNPLNLNIFTDIEIYMNGWRWVCRVESYSESRVFAKDTWSVSGRSPSMELGSPINQKTSYTYDQNGTSVTAGAQIIEDILDGTMLGIDNTGWQLNLDYYHGIIGQIEEVFTGFDPEDGQHWGIPANTFSWTNLTQIEVIKQLADSIGAFIYTEPNCITGSKTIYLKPLINKPPWKWNGTDKPLINHSIRTSYATEVGRSYESLPVYTSVLVMGQSSVDPQQVGNSNGIVVADVYRFGPDRIYAPDIVNPWVTTYRAAGELGRVVLSDTGEWIKTSLRLFSLEEKDNPTPQISGLIVPGDFVEVEERSINWYGLVTSTEITASSQGKGAFAIYQTIEIKQYIGE